MFNEAILNRNVCLRRAEETAPQEGDDLVVHIELLGHENWSFEVDVSTKKSGTLHYVAAELARVTGVRAGDLVFYQEESGKLVSKTTRLTKFPSQGFKCLIPGTFTHPTFYPRSKHIALRIFNAFLNF